MRFFGAIKGSRGQVLRRGTKASGLWASIGAKTLGIEVRCTVTPDGKDVIEVRKTGGLKGHTPETPLLKVVEGGVVLGDAIKTAMPTGRPAPRAYAKPKPKPRPKPKKRAQPKTAAAPAPSPALIHPEDVVNVDSERNKIVEPILVS